MKKFLGGISFYILMFVAIMLFMSMNWVQQEENKKVYSDLVQAIQAGNVTKIDLFEDRVEAKLNDNKKIKVSVLSAYFFNEDMGKDLMKLMTEKKIEVEHHVTPTPPWWMTMLAPLALVILLVVLWMFVLPNAQGGGRSAMNFGKTKARVNLEGQRRVTFDDVAGAEEEKEELKEIVEFLKAPSRFTELGARIPKGVLLVGPPGTGKTLLAKAVAGEAEVPFFSISGSDFVEMYVGVGASRVRDLFEQAKKNQPCIIFIDEIDAVGRHRGAGLGGGHDEREQTLNQLLVEMDGFGINEGVIVIAATNRVDILDPALLRPGRFDRRIEVGYPDIKGREQILRVHVRGKKLAKDVDLSVIAKTTVGFTGADLENLVNEAALLTARQKRKEITTEIIEQAMIKVVAGPEKKSRVVKEKDRKITAYHEAGHAIVSRCLPTQDPVHHVTIIPRGRAAGFTMNLPTEDRHHKTQREMQEDIITLLAGRMAEKLIFQDISTGASNDIQRATNIAKQMVTRFGMSELLGPIAFGSDNDEVFLGREYGHTRNYSENIAAEIDKEIKRIVDECYTNSEELLTEHMDKLHAVAQALLKQEKIDGDEFEALFNGLSIDTKGLEVKTQEDKIEESVEKALTEGDEGNVTDSTPKVE